MFPAQLEISEKSGFFHVYRAHVVSVVNTLLLRASAQKRGHENNKEIV